MKTSGWEIIGPDQARALLATSPGNRRLRKAHVEFLASEMTGGRWEGDSCEGIGIDTNGHLREGHHRMEAVIASGVACEFLVCRNLRPKFALSINRTQPRTIADLLGVGDPVGQILHYVHLLLEGGKPSGQTVMDYYQSAIGTFAEQVSELYTGKSKVISTAPFRLSVVVRLLQGEDADWVSGQVRALVQKDYVKMTVKSQSLVRQIERTMARSLSGDWAEVFARGCNVMTKATSDRELLRATKTEIANILAKGRETLRTAITAHLSRPSSPVA